MAQTIQPLALNVRLSCQLLDVPESSYYERINRHPSKTQLRRQYLSLKISQLFNANRGIYGAPKIHHLLLKQGEKVGLKLIVTLRFKDNIRYAKKFFLLLLDRNKNSEKQEVFIQTWRENISGNTLYLSQAFKVFDNYYYFKLKNFNKKTY